MFSILSSIGWEIPLALLLLGIMGFRISVTPRTSVWVRATPEKVFGVLDIVDGKTSEYGRTKIVHELIDAAAQIYRHTYTTTIMGGTARSFSALFRVSERIPGKSLKMVREGLDGKPKSSELMEITHDLSEEDGGTRFKTAYHWGPRPLLAQITARSDLWGGSFRLKSLIETGIADETAYNVIAAAVALVTGLITLATFSLFLGLNGSLLVIAVLFVHEFGHLLAYRLIGQPWGRMLFLPFLGAVAIPRLPFESQAHAVFAALMGPGLSTFFTIVCAFFLYASGEFEHLYLRLGLVFVLINLFNLLPVEPLDGGIALRSVLTRIMGSFARYGLLAVGAVTIACGLFLSQIILVIFGGIAILANLKYRKIDADMLPLTSLQTTIAAFAYIAMATAYVTLWQFFVSHLPNPVI
jgi:Zn-dependent protease